MLEEIKKEFERRFVPKIIRGKTFTYDWDKEDLENWQWIKSQIESACKKQREICADAFMTKEDYLYIKLNTPDTISTLKRDEILNAPSPKESE